MAGGLPSHRIAKWVGCPYQWANAANGTFTHASNWTNNRVPSAASLVLFGQNPGTNIFNVDFTQNAQSQGLRITKQRPQFNLNGFSYTASNYVSIGEDQVGVLRLSNGTLASPRISVEPLGQLLADAMIEGNLTNKGVLQPGLPGGSLILAGNFTQWPGATFRVSIGPKDADWMSVNGLANLAGTIQVQLRDGADPQIGTLVPVVSAAAITNSFSAALMPFLGADRAMQVQYSSGAIDGSSGVVVVVVPPGGSPELEDSNTIELSGTPTAGCGDSEKSGSGDPAPTVKALSRGAKLSGR